MAFTYIFMGAPGAGKDSQAELLAKVQGGTCISSGAELRRATQQDPAIKSLMDNGGLVPEEEFIRIMSMALARVESSQNLMLSGVTKRPGEVDWLVRELKLHDRAVTSVIVLDVSPTVGLNRISGRAQNRSDDKASKQSRRRHEFDTITMASIERYRSIAPVITINANGTIQEVGDAVLKALELPAI
jgi:adenylate kinase